MDWSDDHDLDVLPVISQSYRGMVVEPIDKPFVKVIRNPSHDAALFSGTMVVSIGMTGDGIGSARVIVDMVISSPPVRAPGLAPGWDPAASVSPRRDARHRESRSGAASS